MNNTTFDTFARLVHSQATRRSLLGAAALAATATRGRKQARAQTSDFGLLVQQFYELVNAYQYGQAYALLGTTWRGKQSLSAFTQGYANTAFVQCEVASTKPLDDGSGNVTVHVRLISWHNDGEIVGYEGAYMVGTEAGVLVILSGDNRRSTVPSSTAPLCTVTDLSLTFGEWEGAAGSRDGSILGQNTGNRTCVVGGSPRVTLLAAGQDNVRSTSQAGSVPMAMTLAPGETASAPLRFSNWCGAAEADAITIELPGSSAVRTLAPGDTVVSYPPCLGEGQEALLQIRGWSAPAG